MDRHDRDRDRDNTRCVARVRTGTMSKFEHMSELGQALLVVSPVSVHGQETPYYVGVFVPVPGCVSRDGMTSTRFARRPPTPKHETSRVRAAKKRK